MSSAAPPQGPSRPETGDTSPGSPPSASSTGPRPNAGPRPVDPAVPDDLAHPRAPRPRPSVAGTSYPGGGPPQTWPTGRLLSAPARRAERRWNLVLEPVRLSHASLPVLAMLSAGARSQRELAHTLGITEQSVSRTVARLEQEGLVERGVDPADRRRRTVASTAAGRRVLARVTDTSSLELEFAERLGEADLATLRALLLRLLEPTPEAP